MQRLLGSAVAVFIGAWVATAPAAVAKEARRPNVVIIVADDLGYADIGAQGISKDVKTPHIDSLAADGVRFRNGYVTAPVCAPSRAGLLTGRYQQRFGFELNPGGVDWPNYGLPATEVPLSDVMRGAGYRTGMIGKWHLGNDPERSPLARGFDEFFGYWGGQHSYVEQTPGWNAVRKGHDRVEKVEYLTDMMGREAADFVERNRAKPFFLYVAFSAVHQPMQAPPKYVERFKGEPDRKRRLMLAMLSAMDYAVGQLLGKLREHGLEEDTLVFFTSDNGGPTDGNGSRNAPLSGYKGQLFEGGVRVPFIARWKGRTVPGTVIDHPVVALDLFATAAALGGAAPPKDRPIDGVDLTPWLAGKAGGPVHERLYWRYAPQWAVREGDWKVMGLGDRAKLFNVVQDPGEKTDRSAEHPDVVKRLRDAYAAWDAQLAKPLWRSDKQIDMDEQEFDRQESPHLTRQRRSGGTAEAE